MNLTIVDSLVPCCLAHVALPSCQPFQHLPYTVPWSPCIW
jgi:hypothetical protein